MIEDRSCKCGGDLDVEGLCKKESCEREYQWNDGTLIARICYCEDCMSTDYKPNSCSASWADSETGTLEWDEG